MILICNSILPPRLFAARTTLSFRCFIEWLINNCFNEEKNGNGGKMGSGKLQAEKCAEININAENSNDDACCSDMLCDDACCKVNALAAAAGKAQRKLARASAEEKNALLKDIASALCGNASFIEAANREDMRIAKEEGMSQGLLDRLLFDSQRVKNTAESVLSVADLPDPTGKIVGGHNLENGVRLVCSRVPLGVVGMIYEARPNVTADIASLCIKSSNAAVLRGGHAAQNTNKAVLRVIGDVLEKHGFDRSLIVSVDEFGRAGADALMKAAGYIDVLIPRGSASLIEKVCQSAKVPVIETGAGNVHIYIDSAADINIAVPIVANAKTQRVGVCNAAEKLLIHKDAANDFLPAIAADLCGKGVLLRADEAAYSILAASGDDLLRFEKADESDWGKEYLDYVLGVRIVDDCEQAIEHINKYSTHHTDAIISRDYNAIERFVAEVDSAVVNVNASTRFTDGGVFGFGAEVGISTQKLHARGPMGPEALTSVRWVAYGSGQVRE